MNARVLTEQGVPVDEVLADEKQESASVSERNLQNARGHASQAAAFYTECSKRGIPLDDAKELTEEWMRIFWGW